MTVYLCYRGIVQCDGYAAYKTIANAASDKAINLTTYIDSMSRYPLRSTKKALAQKQQN